MSEDPDLSRRRFLEATGVTGLTSLAGCLDFDDGSDISEGINQNETNDNNVEDDGVHQNETNDNNVEDEEIDQNDEQELNPKDELLNLKSSNQEIFREALQNTPGASDNKELTGYYQEQNGLKFKLAEIVDETYGYEKSDIRRELTASEDNVNSKSIIRYNSDGPIPFIAITNFSDLDSSKEDFKEFQEEDWFKNFEEHKGQWYANTNIHSFVDNAKNIHVSASSEGMIERTIEFLYNHSDLDHLELEWDLPENELVPEFGINHASPSSFFDSNDLYPILSEDNQGYDLFVNYISIDLENPDYLLDEGLVDEKTLGYNSDSEEWELVDRYSLERDIEEVLTE